MRRWAAVALLLAWAASPLAATDPGLAALQKQLQKRWRGQVYTLRSLPQGDSIETDGAGRLLRPVAQADWTICSLKVLDVRVKSGEVRIQGSRIVRVYVGKQWKLGATDRTISIRILTDPSTLSARGIETLEQNLFVEAGVELVPLLPPYWRAFFLEPGAPSKKIPPGTSPPVAIHSPDPSYTDAARQLRIEGTVLLQATINTAGQIENPAIVEALGAGLDGEAVKMVKTWRFRPATDSTGKPISVSACIQVNFRFIQ